MVEVQENFAHCAKALICSELWKPDSWLARENLPSGPEMLVASPKIPNISADQVAKDLNESYANQLY